MSDETTDAGVGGHPRSPSCSVLSCGQSARPPITPAESDAGDVEALAWDNTFKRAVNVGIDDFRMGRRSNDGLAHDLAAAVLASDWLAARESDAATRARAEERSGVDAVLVCPHNGSGRHYYAADATCQRCEMPSWVEAAVRAARESR